MTKHLKLAEEHYHKMYPGSLIFYRIKENFVAFLEDARQASSILNLPLSFSDDGDAMLSIPHSEFLDKVDLLSSCGIGVHGVSYRNDSGEFSIPDVDQLMEEKDLDY